MKVFGFVLGLCLIATLAFAGAEGKVIATDKDDNGNIRVWTQYKVDGVEVPSRYPKINNKFVYCSRYHVLNFVGMNNGEIKARILEDVDKHTKSLIQKEFTKKANDKIYNNNLGGLVNSGVSSNTTEIEFDLDGDGEKDKKWTIKTDGTYIEEDIIPIVVPIE